MVIISPSGNLYGSEQVLCDFLYNTKKIYTVYVPAKSFLFKYLISSTNKHKVIVYNPSNIKILYLSIALKLLLKKTDAVYINEAGHIRYLALLAKLFPNNKFIAHIRILEDTNPKRLRSLPKNLRLITVSYFMKQNLKDYECKLLYDPYLFSESELPTLKNKNHIKIGIVGRVTKTKGFELIKTLLSSDTLNKINFNLSFHFYGSITDEVKAEFDNLITKFLNVHYHGFVSEKFEIYNNIDLLLHFNSSESLGRVILEAINYQIPFICSSKGGTGEICNLLNLNMFTIDFNEDKWILSIINLLEKIRTNYSHYTATIAEAKAIAEKIFNIEKYVNEIEKIIWE